MTTRREVPFQADTLAWVHNELGDLKSRLELLQRAADQSRALAADASEKALQTRARVDQFDAIGPALMHLQDDMRALREQIVRAQDDIHSLRQSREEFERRLLAETERARQDRNEVARAFSEIEHEMTGWEDRVTGFEEHNRRNLELASQVAQRLEQLEAQQQEWDTLHSRAATALSRIDQDVQRLSGAIGGLEREDDVQRERVTTAIEVQRRLESELEAIKRETHRFNRIEDRLELVQAERTRHNERLNEISTELTKVDSRLNDHHERLALVEVRISGYQDDLRKLREQIQLDREQISGYIHSLQELEADIRKRRIIALEKEIREVRGRALHFAEE